MEISGQQPGIHRTQVCPLNDNRQVKDVWINFGSLAQDENHRIGAIFGRFDDCSGESLRGNYGMNGQDAAVFLPSKAFNHLIDALKWK